jgi:cyclopropane fatty-acyl-phospholipid synthase-like methyltransferase
MITTAMRRGRVGSFVALDADKESLAEVGRAYQKYGVKTVPGSFTALTKKKIDIGTFDLVYSTGLFDYLNQDTGRSLTTAMFNLLKPGGEMVIVNFMPAIRDIGYMETFMAWDLIYRDRNQMLDLARDIDEEKIKGLEIFTSDNKNIIYLKIKKVD